MANDLKYAFLPVGSGLEFKGGKDSRNLKFRGKIVAELNRLAILAITLAPLPLAAHHITRLPHSCDPESALGYLAEDE